MWLFGYKNQPFDSFSSQAGDQRQQRALDGLVCVTSDLRCTVPLKVIATSQQFMYNCITAGWGGCGRRDTTADMREGEKKSWQERKMRRKQTTQQSH